MIFSIGEYQTSKIIYFKNTFNFKENMCQVCWKENANLWKNRLYTVISKKLYKKHKNEFSFIQVGVIQIALIPIFRFGLDAPILAILHDKHHKTLSLDITSKGLNFEEGVQKLTFSYTIIYKVFTTTMHPKALMSSCW